MNLISRLGLIPVPRLAITPERVNDEIRAQERALLYGDVEYRQRVKDRMMQGYACPHPPLIPWTKAREA